MKTIRALGLVLGAAFFFAFTSAAQAAEYEQVPERFGTTGEANSLLSGEVTGLAVNGTGAGGVPAGSVYAVTGGTSRVVVRLTQGEEGEEPEFEEAWGWEIGELGAGGFQRCGPALTTNPAQHTFHTCENPNGVAPVSNAPQHFAPLVGVAVDQANGFVYVRESTEAGRTDNLVEVFTATGTPVGEGFGDEGNMTSSPQESIAQGPSKLHAGGGPGIGSIAVDDSGTVYLNDKDGNIEGKFIARVMSFIPANGTDFEHYEYSGAAKDLRVLEKETPTRIAWAGNNRLVTARFEQVHEYALNPVSSNPICSLAVTGRITALTANPVTGEVFYFNVSKASVVRLAPCNAATGKFSQLQQEKPNPSTELVEALAVNPVGAWSSVRPTGILYVASVAEQASQFNFSGDIFAQAVVLSPVIEGESASETGASSANLLAQINPRGLPTRYSFEYLPASVYEAQLATAQNEGKSGVEAEDAGFAGALTAPSGTAEIPGSAVRTVSISIEGLAPGTVYRFRAIASSDCAGGGEPTCRTVGAASAFSTYAELSAELPDGRAYELVSPSQKNGGEVFPAQAAIGSCGVFACKPPGQILNKVNPMQSAPDGNAVSYMGFPFSATEGAVLNSYVSHRTPVGWQTVSETPSQQAAKSPGTLSYSQGLDIGAVSESSSQIFLRSAVAPFTQANLVPQPRYRGPQQLDAQYGGHSLDFTYQFFAANDSLTAATADAPQPPDPGLAGADLYQWHSGSLSLVNVLPGNVAVAPGATFAATSPDVNWVSSDGERVFWQAGEQLYVREDGDITLKISHPGRFVAASEDGGTVLLGDGCLYALSNEACTDITQGKGGFMGFTAGNQGMSRVYFVDSAKLPNAGVNDYGSEALPGQPNLYLYEAGQATRFIASLAPADGQSTNGASQLNDWGAVSTDQRTAESSPNGRYVTFMSTEPLTGYDNRGPCGRATNGENEEEIVSGPCDEVFLYDSATGLLTCPSCNPSGASPLGNATLRRITLTVSNQLLPQPRYLTDSGRLFFDTTDRLSSGDTNGGVEDVYEVEPGGIGTCGRSAGCVFLISPGTGSVDANFLAMGGEGSNVFFTTRERLVPSDSDDQIDLYDAREGGGFPGEGEIGRSECRGEACQFGAAAPTVPNPNSSSFQGPGNPKPVHCSKNKVKKDSKCVRRKKKARKSKSSPKKAGRHGNKKVKKSNRGGVK